MSALVLVTTLAGAVVVYLAARRFGVTARQAALLACVSAAGGIAGLLHGPDALGPRRAADLPPPGKPPDITLAASQLALLLDTGATAAAVIDTVAVSPPASGSADPVRRTARLRRGATVSYVGWAADPRTRGPGLGIVAFVDGKPAAQGTYGGARADVAANEHRDGYYWSGFRVDLPTAALAPGAHAVRLALVTGDARGYETIEAPLRLTVSGR